MLSILTRQSTKGFYVYQREVHSSTNYLLRDIIAWVQSLDRNTAKMH